MCLTGHWVIRMITKDYLIFECEFEIESESRKHWGSVTGKRIRCPNSLWLSECYLFVLVHERLRWFHHVENFFELGIHVLREKWARYSTLWVRMKWTDIGSSEHRIMRCGCIFLWLSKTREFLDRMVIDWYVEWNDSVSDLCGFQSAVKFWIFTIHSCRSFVYSNLMRCDCVRWMGQRYPRPSFLRASETSEVGSNCAER